LKHYLTIGLIISFGVLFNSCKDVAYVSTSDFYFVNATNYAFTYETGLEKFNVSPKSTTRFTDRKQSFGGGVSRTTPPPMLDNPVLAASVAMV
jgi:outer membrane protein assembly factor BamB